MPVLVEKKPDHFVFNCKKGDWEKGNGSKMSLSYKDGMSGDYKCGPEESYLTVTVKFRSKCFNFTVKMKKLRICSVYKTQS